MGNISVDYDVLNQKGSPAWYSDVYANIPTPGYKGRMFISTDTYAFYRDNGTGWDLVGGPGTGTITGSGASGQVTYFNGSDTIGGSNNLFWDITNARLGINTNTPGVALDLHATTGVVAQFENTTTNNTLLSFRNQGAGLWSIGNNYSGGINDFVIYDAVSFSNRLTIKNTGVTTLIGTFTATSLIKSGGTSSQILLADGSTTPTSTFGTGSVTSVAALTLGTTGTDLTSSVANSTTTPVITLNVPTASATNRGALSSADWTIFNSKQATISVTAPVVLTGATISMPAATTSISGYLTSTDWNTFNNKTSNVGTVTDVVALTIGTTGIDITSTAVTTTTTPVITLNIPTASASNRGALSSTDWTTFNNKQATLSLTTTGTSGAATFTSNTLNIPNYGSALSGYLPLSGGTLTGPLNGTSASFSGTGSFLTSLSSTYDFSIRNSGTGNTRILLGNATSSARVTISCGATASEFARFGPEGNFPLYLQTNGTDRLTIDGSTGAATFSSTGLFNGELSVGGTLSADRMFQVSGTAFTSGATQFGIVNNPTMTTPTTIYGYYGGVTVTSATTAYGMYIVSNSGTITNKFGLYQEGTNDINYFAGLTGIQTNNPGYTLDVAGTGQFRVGLRTGEATAATNVNLTLNGVVNKAQRIVFQNSGTDQWLLGPGAASETSAFELYNATGTISMEFNKTNNASTFRGNMNINKVTPTIILKGTDFGNSGAAIELLGWAGIYNNWKIDVAVLSNNYLGFTPSTTGGGSTFTTPVFYVTPVGAGVFSSTLGINGTSNNVRSGTYTPTVTAGTNCAAVTAYPCQYMQVDKVVTVSGYVYGSATAITTETQFTMSTPVNTNFTQVYQCGGTGRSAQGGVSPSGAGYVASISANATNEVRFSYTAPAVLGTGGYFWFSFTYQII